MIARSIRDHSETNPKYRVFFRMWAVVSTRWPGNPTNGVGYSVNGGGDRIANA